MRIMALPQLRICTPPPSEVAILAKDAQCTETKDVLKTSYHIALRAMGVKN